MSRLSGCWWLAVHLACTGLFGRRLRARALDYSRRVA